MKRKGLSLLLCALLLLALGACGSASYGGDNGSGGGTSSAPVQGEAARPGGMSPGSDWNGFDYEWGEPEEAPMPMPDGSMPSGGTLPGNTKIIYTAELSLETQEFDSAVQAVNALVGELGGWFESRDLNQGGSYRSMECTIRIPAEHFNDLLDRAGQTAHVTNRYEYSNDVSEAYYDTEARLTTQRTKLERLQTLLAQAATMADIIDLENAISATELEIEYLTGSLRHYDSLIGYSTVNLHLREVYRLSSEEEPATTFGQRFSAALSAGLQSGIDSGEDFLIFLARNWVGLVFLAVVIVIAVVVVLRVRKRKKASESEKPPEPEK